jgi:hypothetical protein
MAATGSVARRISRGSGHPGKLVIADATTWPGVPIAGWPPADLSVDYVPPRGRGIQGIPVDTPLACWLPIKPGLTVRGLRHGRKTWMAEDGTPLRNRLPPSRQATMLYQPLPRCTAFVGQCASLRENSHACSAPEVLRRVGKRCLI